MNIFIDIETIPDQTESALERHIDSIKAPGQYKKPDSIAKWIAENKETEGHKSWLMSALNGTQGEIICISFCGDDGVMSTVSRKLEQPEGDLLMQFNDLLSSKLELNGHIQKPYFIGHNARDFDLPFIFKRMVINGVQPSFKFNAYARHESDMFDTMLGWEGYKGRISLDNLSKALNLSGKTEGMSGGEVWPAIQGGQYETVFNYCEDDVRLVRDIFNRMTFNHPVEIKAAA